MKNPDKLWWDICNRYAEQSQCKSRKVGCVLVLEDRAIGQGWNGAPEGSSVSDCRREKCYNANIKSGTDLHEAICVHGEINCISYCARHGVATRGSTLYCTTYPCLYCAGALIGAKVKEIVYDQSYPNEVTELILKNAGIKVRRFENCHE